MWRRPGVFEPHLCWKVWVFAELTQVDPQTMTHVCCIPPKIVKAFASCVPFMLGRGLKITGVHGRHPALCYCCRRRIQDNRVKRLAHLFNSILKTSTLKGTFWLVDSCGSVIVVSKQCLGCIPAWFILAWGTVFAKSSRAELRKCLAVSGQDLSSNEPRCLRFLALKVFPFERPDFNQNQSEQLSGEKLLQGMDLGWASPPQILTLTIRGENTKWTQDQRLSVTLYSC